MRTQALRNEQELFKQKGRKSGQQKLHEAEERENRRVMECESELGLESSPVELRLCLGSWGGGEWEEVERRLSTAMDWAHALNTMLNISTFGRQVFINKFSCQTLF